MGGWVAHRKKCAHEGMNGFALSAAHTPLPLLVLCHVLQVEDACQPIVSKLYAQGGGPGGAASDDDDLGEHDEL